MPTEPAGSQPRSVLAATALPILFDALHQRGYTVAGPTLRDGAIVVAELATADELPYGWGVQTDAGSYRVRARDDRAVFGHSAGPQSWKAILHPPRAKQWTADRSTGTVSRPQHGGRRFALLGVRPCDVRAVAILDRVLTGGRHADPVYQGRRDGALVIAVECTEPGGTCFCASMGTGPGADTGYDIAMTELIDGEGHRFVVRAGTPTGAEILAALPCVPADEATAARAGTEVAGAAHRMGRTMPAADLPGLLAASRTSAHWDDVASRCLTCGNCTMVCPTCFCTTTEDVTDLRGEHAERWRVWDSCYALDFSYLHGGSVRESGQGRYRQWISHKLGTWYDQFGSSGCVGCGRCISWCPTGIDITQEMSALAVAQGSHPAGGAA